MAIKVWNRCVFGLLIVGVLGLFQTAWPRRIEVAAIHVYQQFGSPLMGHILTCRFDPTCSEYALHALQTEGFWQGNLRIGLRLIRCSPVGLLL